MLHRRKPAKNMIKTVLSRTYSLDFVPKHAPVIDSDIDTLRNFIETSSRIVVLTGAGISTESGIPDYRSEGVGLYARTNHRPVTIQEFLKSPAIRQRYWARNYTGWPKFSQARPNTGHDCVTKLEHGGKVSCIVTQNVDSLHSKSGARNVVELHGTAYRVVCLNCPQTYDRHNVQKSLEILNPELRESSKVLRPDGDVDIDPKLVEQFTAPFCERCGGVLKPDIVFFGDNVPRHRVELIRNHVSSSDSLLVLGSSLTVFSAYRIILQAVEEKKRIAVVNIGSTRADSVVDVKIVAKCGDILPKVCSSL